MGFFGVKLECHIASKGSFHVTSIPPLKKKGKKIQTSDSSSSSWDFQRCSVFISLMKTKESVDMRQCEQTSGKGSVQDHVLSDICEFA